MILTATNSLEEATKLFSQTLAIQQNLQTWFEQFPATSQLNRYPKYQWLYLSLFQLRIPQLPGRIH